MDLSIQAVVGYSIGFHIWLVEGVGWTAVHSHNTPNFHLVVLHTVQTAKAALTCHMVGVLEEDNPGTGYLQKEVIAIYPDLLEVVLKEDTACLTVARWNSTFQLA